MLQSVMQLFAYIL